MKEGRIEGPEIGLSQDRREWVLTRKEHECGICHGAIPANTLAYRQAVLENGRYDRHYTYCQKCMAEKGNTPPQDAVQKEEASRQAHEAEDAQMLLFPEDEKGA